MIVADTGAVLALIDRSDRHHTALVRLYQESPDRWILPWAILPEVDFLVGAHLGARAQHAFLADLREGAFTVAWGDEDVLSAAVALHVRHASFRLGLVDAVVIATATKIRASAIATLDLKHFGAITIPGAPKLFPRDLA
jgi:hypothetical protein